MKRPRKMLCQWGTMNKCSHLITFQQKRPSVLRDFNKIKTKDKKVAW